MIEAISRTCKTMADGTLRLTVDIEPNSALTAFQLFGMPDVPMVLARLTQEASIQSAQAETIAAEKLKGGLLAKWAGILCNDPQFIEFIMPIYDRLMGGNGTGCGDLAPDDIGGDEEYNRHAILVICGIDSRRMLDHDKKAGQIFRDEIMKPFDEWKAKNA